MPGTDLRSISTRAWNAWAPWRSRLLGAPAIAVLLGGLLAGCGAAGVRAADRRHGPALARARQVSDGPRIGTTQRVDAAGAHLSVTVVKVVDLPADDGAPVLPGFRGVGIKVKISNAGPAAYDSLATSDFSITATDPNVHLLFVPAGLCRTPATDFDSHITAGEHRSGCLAFRIHQRARVTAVTFSPYGKPVSRLSWDR